MHVDVGDQQNTIITDMAHKLNCTYRKRKIIARGKVVYNLRGMETMLGSSRHVLELILMNTVAEEYLNEEIEHWKERKRKEC